MKFTPETVARALKTENKNSKSANPYQHIVLYRDGLRKSFGEDSSMFRNTVEGMAYALHRTMYECGGAFNADIYDVERLIKEKLKTLSPEQAYQFLHGYVIGLSYLFAAWETCLESNELSSRTALLLHLFLSPAGTLY